MYSKIKQWDANTVPTALRSKSESLIDSPSMLLFFELLRILFPGLRLLKSKILKHYIDRNSSLLLFYPGFAAANHYDTTGGGTDFQCLPLDPEYNAFSSSGYRSIISGAEYETHDYGIFPNAAHDQNVPCARCYSSRSAVMMLPAKRTCPESWNKEYEGEK